MVNNVDKEGISTIFVGVALPDFAGDLVYLALEHNLVTMYLSRYLLLSLL